MGPKRQRMAHQKGYYLQIKREGDLNEEYKQWPGSNCRRDQVLELLEYGN